LELIYSIPQAFYPGSNREENAAVLRISLDYLIALNLDYLRRHTVPPLYQENIYYKRTVEFEPIPAVQLRGYGDCKSLTAWRIAEYRRAGKFAKPVFRWNPRSDGMYDYHILIFLGITNGISRHEDPSKVFGMTGAENGEVWRDPLDELLYERERKAERGR
jgi:hypothetical protein